MNAPLNTSDRKSIRAAEKAAATLDQQRGEVLTALMNTLAGREYIWNKLSSANIFHSTFSTDPIQMAFNEGQRNQGLVLLNDIIQWCPDSFILAMREHNERSTSTGRDTAAGTSTGQLGPSEEPDGGDSGPAEDPA